MASIRCTCGGTRTMNLPLNCRVDIGSGIGSLLRRRSATTSLTSFRMPCNDFSGDDSSQLKLGNSAHKPTYSWSSSDQVTRYVKRSTSLAITHLYSFNCQEDLTNLISFRLAFVTLNIDPRVPGPWRSINSVASPPFPGFAKEMVTNLAQIFEAHPFRASPHIGQYVLNGCHPEMISLLILLSRYQVKLRAYDSEAYNA